MKVSARWAGFALGALCSAATWAGSSITINNPSVTEGNSGTTPLPFTIARSGDTGSQVLFQYQTVNATATAPSDYVSLASTNLAIASGATNSTINVTVNGDATPENDEQFFLNLTGAVAVGPPASFGSNNIFSIGSVYPNGRRPYDVTSGDINGDGKPDLAVTSSGSNEISVLLNTTTAGAASPSFAPPVLFGAGFNPQYVFLGDVNGDGKADLVVSNSGTGSILTTNMSVLLNTTPPGAATPSFATAVTFLDQTGCSPSVLGDLNSDGKLDVVASCSNGSVTLLVNTTTPGATTPSFALAGSVPSTGFTLTNLVLGDLNGDGKVDLVMTAAGDKVFALINTTAPGASNVTFGAVQTFHVGDIPAGISIGDVNGDGKPDLVVSVSPDYGQPTQRSGRASILLNTTTSGAATATFAAPSEFLANSVKDNENAIALSDLNGDGRPDLAVLEGVNGVGIFVKAFLNTTPPGAVTLSFQHLGGVYIGGSLARMAVGDFNGDGKSDVVAANNDPGYNNVSVLLNTTSFTTDVPSFTSVSSFAAGTNPVSAAATDLNGDGVLDVAVANSGGNNVSVLLGTTVPGVGIASFASAISFAAGTAPSTVALGDINNDGLPDIAVANQSSGNASILLNTTAAGATTPTFAAATTFSAGTGPNSLALTDLNGDGRRDLIIANGGSNNISVVFNTTGPGALTPAFASASTLAVGTNPRSVAMGDLNGDGVADVVVANQGSNNVSVLLNTTAPGAASPTFAAVSNFATGGGPVAVSAGDLNGDGKPDLAVINSADNTVSVLFNTTTPGATTAGFLAATTFAAGQGPRSIVLSDLDDDGMLDIAVADQAGNAITVLLNKTAPGATSPTLASIGAWTTQGPVAITAADLNGDGQRDLIASGGNGISALLNTLYTVNLVSSQGVGTIVDDDTDGVPNPFSFTAQPGVPTSTVVISNAITVSGINVPAMISVTGGEYSVDGATFTAADGSVNNTQSVRVRHTSASAPNTATNTTLTIGGVSSTFTSTTAGSGGGPDTTPDPFSFADQSNVAVSTVVVSNSDTISGINAPAAMSVAGGEYSIDGAAFTTSNATITSGQSVRVRHTSASTANTPTNTTLTVGGVAGTFTSVTAPVGGGPPPAGGGGGGGSLCLLDLSLWPLALLAARRRRKVAAQALGEKLVVMGGLEPPTSAL